MHQYHADLTHMSSTMSEYRSPNVEISGFSVGDIYIDDLRQHLKIFNSCVYMSPTDENVTENSEMLVSI